MNEAKNVAVRVATPKLLTVDEVAEALQCSPRAVAAWTASGELASVKLGRLRRYRPEDVEAFIRLRVEGRPEESADNSGNNA